MCCIYFSLFFFLSFILKLIGIGYPISSLILLKLRQLHWVKSVQNHHKYNNVCEWKKKIKNDSTFDKKKKQNYMRIFAVLAIKFNQFHPRTSKYQWNAANFREKFHIEMMKNDTVYFWSAISAAIDVKTKIIF